VINEGPPWPDRQKRDWTMTVLGVVRRGGIGRGGGKDAHRKKVKKMEKKKYIGTGP